MLTDEQHAALDKIMSLHTTFSLEKRGFDNKTIRIPHPTNNNWILYITKGYGSNQFTHWYIEIVDFVGVTQSWYNSTVSSSIEDYEVGKALRIIWQQNKHKFV